MQYQPHNLKDLWNLSNGYFAVGLQDAVLNSSKSSGQFGGPRLLGRFGAIPADPALG